MMVVEKIKTSLIILGSHIVYGLSFLVPRDKTMWVFSGWHRGKKGEVFTDNSKYLFLYISNNVKNIKAVWIGMDESLCQKLKTQGHLAYNKNTLLGIYSSLRASCTFVDSYLQRENYRYSGGSNIIQLLHGKGVKKLGYKKVYPTYSNPINQLFARLVTPQLFLSFDYVFVPSDFVAKILPKGLKTKKTKFFVTGYPRNDILFKEIPGSDIGTSLKLKEKLKELKRKGQKFILYMPTFRRGKRDGNLESVLDFSALDLLMQQQRTHFFIKLHPKFGQQKMREIENKNITLIEESDIHPLLKHFDILITDYSSIFVDFLLVDKPIIFFPYDLKEYAKKEGFLFNYEEYTPGPKVFNSNELLETIGRIIRGEDKFKEKREKIKKLYHQYTDGKSAERITNIVLKNVHNKNRFLLKSFIN